MLEVMEADVIEDAIPLDEDVPAKAPVAAAAWEPAAATTDWSEPSAEGVQPESQWDAPVELSSEWSSASAEQAPPASQWSPEAEAAAGPAAQWGSASAEPAQPAAEWSDAAAAEPVPDWSAASAEPVQPASEWAPAEPVQPASEWSSADEVPVQPAAEWSAAGAEAAQPGDLEVGWSEGAGDGAQPEAQWSSESTQPATSEWSSDAAEALPLPAAEHGAAPEWGAAPVGGWEAEEAAPQWDAQAEAIPVAEVPAAGWSEPEIESRHARVGGSPRPPVGPRGRHRGAPFRVDP